MSRSSHKPTSVQHESDTQLSMDFQDASTSEQSSRQHLFKAFDRMRAETDEVVQDLLNRMKEKDDFIQALLSGQTSTTADPGSNSVFQSFMGRFFSQRSCQNCQQKDLRISKLEEELTKKRTALEKTQRELSSLKDRVAVRMSQMPNPDNVENMNSPVNTDGLDRLYQKLQYEIEQRHQRIKKDKIKEAFKAAEEAVGNLRKPIDAICGDKDSHPQVEKFRQTALENLQLALYHSSDTSKLEAYKAAHPSIHPSSSTSFRAGSQRKPSEPSVHTHQAGTKRSPSESPEEQELAKCFWLGCLMALHCPPRRPHWQEEEFTDRNPWPKFKEEKHKYI